MARKTRVKTTEIVNYNNKILEDHLKDYDESTERDICDAFIAAKNESLKAGKQSAAYLNNANIAATILDLFIGGADTSQQTFQWMLLFVAYYPETQQKLRQEIESEIGDRIPTLEDRDRCH